MSTHVIVDGPPGVLVRTDEVVIECASSAEVVATALRAAAKADRLELCGAVPVTVAAEIVRRVGDDTDVRVNRYGFESLEQAAAFKEAYSAGRDPGPAAFFYLAEVSTPIERHAEVIVAGVATVDDVRQRAREVRALGAGIVELYGGLGAASASAVREATEGRLPVGFID